MIRKILIILCYCFIIWSCLKRRDGEFFAERWGKKRMESEGKTNMCCWEKGAPFCAAANQDTLRTLISKQCPDDEWGEGRAILSQLSWIKYIIKEKKGFWDIFLYFFFCQDDMNKGHVLCKKRFDWIKRIQRGEILLLGGCFYFALSQLHHLIFSPPQPIYNSYILVTKQYLNHFHSPPPLSRPSLPHRELQAGSEMKNKKLKKKNREERKEYLIFESEMVPLVSTWFSSLHLEVVFLLPNCIYQTVNASCLNSPNTCSACCKNSFPPPSNLLLPTYVASRSAHCPHYSFIL